jgi:hypothetical protein
LPSGESSRKPLNTRFGGSQNVPVAVVTTRVERPSSRQQILDALRRSKHGEVEKSREEERVWIGLIWLRIGSSGGFM